MHYQPLWKMSDQWSITLPSLTPGHLLRKSFQACSAGWNGLFCQKRWKIKSDENGCTPKIYRQNISLTIFNSDIFVESSFLYAGWGGQGNGATCGNSQAKYRWSTILMVVLRFGISLQLARSMMPRPGFFRSGVIWSCTTMGKCLHWKTGWRVLRWLRWRLRCIPSDEWSKSGLSATSWHRTIHQNYDKLKRWQK